MYTYSDVDSLRSTFTESVGDPDIYHDAWIKFLSDHFKRFVREIAEDHGFSYEELSYSGSLTGNFVGELDKEVISRLLNDERVAEIHLCDEGYLVEFGDAPELEIPLTQYFGSRDKFQSILKTAQVIFIACAVFLWNNNY